MNTRKIGARSPAGRIHASVTRRSHITGRRFRVRPSARWSLLGTPANAPRDAGFLGFSSQIHLRFIADSSPRASMRRIVSERDHPWTREETP